MVKGCVSIEIIKLNNLKIIINSTELFKYSLVVISRSRNNSLKKIKSNIP